MYITLKGIGKILFVSVLRILLISTFLNVATVLTKKNFEDFACNSSCGKINFNVTHRIHITIHSF